MNPKTSLTRLAAGYLAFIVVPLAALLGVLRWGNGIHAKPSPDLASQIALKTVSGGTDLFLVILQISMVLLAARILGALFRLMKQPRVVGEMVAGVFLGPSLLGWWAAGLSAAIFPASSLGYLNVLSQVGLVLYMFLIGLEVKPKDLKELGRAALIVSLASITIPMSLGATLAIYLYPRLSNDSVTFLGFALFLGSAMSITAFPVLARILTERNLLDTRMGILSIACAAVNDVTGWCVLAVIVFVIRTQSSSPPLWVTIGGSAAFAVFVIYVLRPLLGRFERSFRRNRVLEEGQIAILILLVLASALVTERLGIHLLFGAFLLGAVMPKDQAFVSYITDRFESVTIVFLLPLFFAYSGLRTNIGLLHGGEVWLYCLVIVVVAVTGKLAGSALAARACGMNWREAAEVGILMNTRGLMELVILNIGLDLKVISQELFSMMVIMALATTFMTTPLLQLVSSRKLSLAQHSA
jgi:Kef-type K+ transport system membrane component KefB